MPHALKIFMREQVEVSIYKLKKGGYQASFVNPISNRRIRHKFQLLKDTKHFERKIHSQFFDWLAVRQLSNQSAEIVGTDLMRRAFGPPNGPLVPIDLPKSEQESLAHLFAGAIGWFKNPQSHRNVGLGNIDYAVQVLMFASHLMYLAELMDMLYGQPKEK